MKVESLSLEREHSLLVLLGENEMNIPDTSKEDDQKRASGWPMPKEQVAKVNNLCSKKP